MSLWLTHPLLLPSLIVGVTIVLWATSLLPEFITALLFFTAAMTARIAPPEVIFGGFASSAFWLVFSGFVLGVAIRKTGTADRAARALSAKLTDSRVLMVASVVLLSYATAFVMPSNMGRIALLMPIVAAMAKRAGIPDGSRAGLAGAGGRVWHLPALGHYFARQRAQPGDERRGGRLIRHPPELCSVSAAAHPGAGYSQRPDSDWPDLLAVPRQPETGEGSRAIGTDGA